MAYPTEGPIDADEILGINDGDDPFRSYQQAFNLSEQDLTMAASNAQPARRGGVKPANTHAPHQDGQPSSSFNAAQPPVQGNTKPIKTPGTAKNANKLH